VPKHVGVIKDCTIVYVACVFSWFSKRNKLIKMHGISNFKTEGVKPLGTPKCRGDNDIKMDLKELTYEGMDWIICNRGK
jgi:hypothetical protein